MLIDANILLYALDTQSPHHQRAAAWVEEAFNGEQRVALPLQTLGAVIGQLAAMAIEQGIPVASTDTDFARFGEITWINPLAI